MPDLARKAKVTEHTTFFREGEGLVVEMDGNSVTQARFSNGYTPAHL